MKRWTGTLLLGLGLTGLIWLAARRQPAQAVRAQPSTALEAAKPASAHAQKVEEPEPAPPPRQPALPPAVVGPPPLRKTPMEAVEAPPDGPPIAPVVVLQNMRGAVRQYCSRFGGNPIGNNREITASLQGHNRQQAMFMNPEEDGLRINDRGESVDSWGTPFFFHQVSATEMEIRSAGPDRKLWTADDLVVK